MHLRSPPERVFRLLTTSEGRAQFWAEEAVERDSVIHFSFVNGVTTASPILRTEPNALFEIRYFGSVARFDLTPDGSGGTDLVLTNSGVADTDWIEVHAGWLNVLFPLKAAADFGVDLRSHDPGRTWDRGYIDQ
jgi:uncharacterized protein YndB with AHSA1/START domain